MSGFKEINDADSQLGGSSKENEWLEEARQDISIALAKTMDLYGVPPSIGMLFATLYFSDEPLTLDELRESMGMSKTSMSTGVRRLEENKMVKKVWKKGVRKHLYEVETNFFNHFEYFFVPMWKREIKVNMEAIKIAEPKLLKLAESSDDSIRKEAIKDLEKIVQAKKYYRWLGKLAESIETGEIYQFIPKDEE